LLGKEIDLKYFTWWCNELLAFNQRGSPSEAHRTSANMSSTAEQCWTITHSTAP